MRKNYFVKNLLAASMLLVVSMGMVSCQGLLDAIVGSQDNPSSQPSQPSTQPTETVVTPTAQGAKVEASSPEAVSKALATLVDDIKAKGVGEGKEYKVEVSGVSSESTASENTIVVPKVENSNINLVFTEAVATSSAPLVVKASETTSTESKAAVNELTITVPNAESLDLKVDMPETTVTLKSSGSNSVIKSIVAKTALNTLIIESGVTVEELEVQGGRVIVKSGGKIETYVYPAGKKNSDGKAFISVCYDENLASYAGVLPPKLEVDGTVCYEISTDEEGEKPYLAKYLKVVKGSEDEAEVNFLNQHGHFLEKMTVGDGANVVTRGIRAKEIEGEGTAKITFICIESWHNPKSGYWHEPTPDNMDEFYWQFGTNGLKGVEKISNIIFAKPKKEWDGEYFTFLKQISATLENCTFQYDCVFFGNDFGYELGKGTEYTLSNDKVIKNCKFETRSIPYPNIAQGVIMYVPGQNVGDTFTMTFENCEFNEGTCIQYRPTFSDNKLIGYVYYTNAGINTNVSSLDDIPSNCLDNIDGYYYYSYDYDNPITYTYSGNRMHLIFNDCLIGGSDLTDTTVQFTSWGGENPSSPRSDITFEYLFKVSSVTTTLTW